MYFTNIADENVSFFHGKILVNFNLLLTDVLNSNMFKIEEIIPDNVYRIYPLFYCESISSTNSSDKILSNKCIICQKLENTVLCFNSDVDYSNLPISDFNYIYEQGSFDFIVFYCFDNNNNPLSNVNANCSLYYSANNALIGNFDIKSKSDGYLIISKEDVRKIFNYEDNGNNKSMNVFLTYDGLSRNYSINIRRVVL